MRSKASQRWSERYRDARVVLELPPRKTLTRSMVQTAWREQVKIWHPDINPRDKRRVRATRNINLARDLLLTAIDQRKAGTAPPAPKRRRRRSTLLITPEGHLFGDNDLFLGNAGTVAFAIAYCGRAGWKYELCNQLSESQQRALDNRSKPKRRKRR